MHIHKETSGSSRGVSVQFIYLITGINIYNVVIRSRKKSGMQFITHLQISYVRQKNHPEVEPHPECLQTHFSSEHDKCI